MAPAGCLTELEKHMDQSFIFLSLVIAQNALVGYLVEQEIVSVQAHNHLQFTSFALFWISWLASSVSFACQIYSATNVNHQWFEEEPKSMGSREFERHSITGKITRLSESAPRLQRNASRQGHHMH